MLKITSQLLKVRKQIPNWLPEKGETNLECTVISGF